MTRWLIFLKQCFQSSLLSTLFLFCYCFLLIAESGVKWINRLWYFPLRRFNLSRDINLLGQKTNCLKRKKTPTKTLKIPFSLINGIIIPVTATIELVFSSVYDEMHPLWIGVCVYLNMRIRNRKRNGNKQKNKQKNKQRK